MVNAFVLAKESSVKHSLFLNHCQSSSNASKSSSNASKWWNFFPDIILDFHLESLRVLDCFNFIRETIPQIGPKPCKALTSNMVPWHQILFYCCNVFQCLASTFPEFFQLNHYLSHWRLRVVHDIYSFDWC